MIVAHFNTAALHSGTQRGFGNRPHVEDASGVALVLVVAILVSACDGDASARLTSACRTASLCAVPAPPAQVADLLVDTSVGAPTNVITATDDAITLLTSLTSRPGSIERIWILGTRFEDTRPIYTMTVPTFRARSTTARAAEEARYVAQERARVSTALTPFFVRPLPRSSPIVEGITRVAMADGFGQHRVLVATTDGRQVSSLGFDFECMRRLPTVEQFQTALRAQRLLESGALSGIEVYVARMSAPPIPGRDCPVGIARELHIRHLLRLTLRSAGAARVEIESEGLSLNQGARQQAGE